MPPKGGEPTGVGFHELEDKFGGRANRSALIHCIRYCWLDGRFDQKLYRAIDAKAPMEAHGLMDDFGPDDVTLE